MADPTPNEYDIGQDITLVAVFLTGATVGTIRQGSTTVYVREPLGLDLTTSAPIMLERAGYAGGDLWTTVVSADGQAIEIADPSHVIGEASLITVGTPTDPDPIQLVVRQPDGTETDPISVTSPRTGQWEGVFTPTQDGEHFYRWQGAGAAAADRWRKFTVRPERVPE